MKNVLLHDFAATGRPSEISRSKEIRFCTEDAVAVGGWLGFAHHRLQREKAGKVHVKIPYDTFYVVVSRVE